MRVSFKTLLRGAGSGALPCFQYGCLLESGTIFFAACISGKITVVIRADSM
jgi:hypothetical protein